MNKVTLKEKDYFKLISENIILKDIYVKNKLKNYNLLIKLIKLLAMTNKLLSAKEIHKILNYNDIKVSHVTTLEYLDCILKSNLIKKVYRLNLKTKNISVWKAKYVFSNSKIRKSILNDNIKQHIFNENIVYQTLIELWYKEIYTWKNWTFDFSFVSGNNIIHISEHSNKNEIKKEITKLKKIDWGYHKYLIINSIKDTWIRPSTYLPLEILEIKNFINKIK